MSRKILLLSSFLFTIFITAESQVWMGTTIRVGPRGRYGRPNRANQQMPKYEPTVNVSLGYGFPNLDKNLLGDFYNYYRGNTSQTGPLTAAVDYQYSKYKSIGILATYGKASVDYNSYGSSSPFTGNIESWSVMLNLMNYLPGSNKVSPYFRTAIGINAASENYLYNDGTVVAPSTTPSELAYQIGLGAKFLLSKNSSFFAEAGYGKYILHAGLSFKF